MLTPGRYVGAEEVEDDDEPFDDKMKRLTGTLEDLEKALEELKSELRPRLTAEIKAALHNQRARLIADLEEKVRHYVGDPEERERIARRGQDAVLRDHTYAGRLRQLLEEAGRCGSGRIAAGATS